MSPEYPLLSADNLCKAYENGLIPALTGVSLTLRAGKTYALMGPSGCGKSTLLHIIGALDVPDSGSLRYFTGTGPVQCEPLPLFRRRHVGFIFQFHHLIPILTLQENVELPLLARPGVSAAARKNKATLLLEKLGLADKRHAMANRVSGGERQRAAIARALVNDPPLLLADEPTGSVDSKTARLILDTLITHTTASHGTLLLATHDKHIAGLADLIIQMKDGRIVAQPDTEENKLQPAPNAP